MLTTPRKQKHHKSSMNANECNNSVQHKSVINMNANSSRSTASEDTVVFENGTMIGNISNNTTIAMDTANTGRLNGTSNQIGTNTDTYPPSPEVLISGSCRTNSLVQSLCEMSECNNEDSAIESTALLETTEVPTNVTNELQEEPAILQDEFDQFILNRTTSESNILESSIYSELHFPPSLHGGSVVGINTNNGVAGVVVGGGYVSGSGGLTATAATQSAAQQVIPPARQTKRTKRKHKTKSKCTATTATLAAVNQRTSPTHYPPRYTAIFMDAHHHANQYSNMVTTNQHHGGGGAANAFGQIASAAATSPFLNGPVAADPAAAAAAAAYMHQFQYFQQRPMVTAMAPMGGHYRHHRSLYDGGATSAGIENPLNLHISPTNTVSVPASGSGIAPPLRISFRKWLSRPSLPLIIGILALGGVACTLGGIVLGSTGLIEHSTQYLSAALLMIGIGVSLLVISGAIWRLSLPDDVDECACYRHMEMCRNCNSPYCNSRLMSGSYLYPEFQHRPPPPSYLTSLNECAGMSLLFHPTAAPQQPPFNAVRVNTPPPVYRSTNSLSVYRCTPIAGTAGTTIVPNTTTSSVGIAPDHNAITMNRVMDNLQGQAQTVIKEFNYLELD